MELGLLRRQCMSLSCTLSVSLISGCQSWQSQGTMWSFCGPNNGTKKKHKKRRGGQTIGWTNGAPESTRPLCNPLIGTPAKVPTLPQKRGKRALLEDLDKIICQAPWMALNFPSCAENRFRPSYVLGIEGEIPGFALQDVKAVAQQTQQGLEAR